MQCRASALMSDVKVGFNCVAMEKKGPNGGDSLPFVSSGFGTSKRRMEDPKSDDATNIGVNGVADTCVGGSRKRQMVKLKCDEQSNVVHTVSVNGLSKRISSSFDSRKRIMCDNILFVYLRNL